jgi:ABC-type transport system substrate-binding protein
VANNADDGLPNYFTWLDAWNPNPAQAGTIRQGFSEKTNSVNPYDATSQWDAYITGSIYDSLYQANPLNPVQEFNWMTEITQQISNSSLDYTPPSGTLTTYRFTLRPDLSFQDGNPVTAYDVAFSYLSMVGSGAFLGTAASTMTGITIIGPRQFDISVNSLGPFTLPNLTSIPIVPGRYWTNAGSAAWGSAIATCSAGAGCGRTQYTLTGATVNCSLSCNPSTSLMTINPADLTFDPIANHTFVGSGPWTCGTVTASGSGQCTPSGVQNPLAGQSYTLTAYPNYFRSSQRLAIYLWSGEGDTNAIGPATAVASCFNVAVNLAGPCSHYQQGAGNPGSGTSVSVSTVGNVDIFFNMNWLAPFEWTTSPPTGIAPLPPLLYGPGTTFTPNPGGSSCTTPNTYYDC